ncbi:MAG TPA: PAS domain S-box protein [Ginsengibacter sp.]
MNEHLKILLLEDSETDAEIVKHLLRKSKPLYEFRLVMSEKDYISALEEFRPDLILSDNSMPQFSAKDALEIKQRRNLPIPFIMVTGSATEEFAAGIIKLGADDYIIKDRMTRLPVAIDAALKQKRAEKEKGETEKKIIESENNLKTIFENTNEGFLLMDTNGTVKAINKIAASYGLFMGKKEIEVGDDIFDYTERARKDLFEETIAKVLKGEEIEYEQSFTSPNGSVKWLELSIIPVRENEEVTGICINGSDITEKKKIQQEREFDAENLKALINNTDDLIWSVDKNFRLITYNNSLGRYVKKPSGKGLLNEIKLLTSHFGKVQLDRFKEYYERAFKGESFTIIEHHAEIWSEISFYPIYNKSEIIGTACFSKDITLRKHAENASTKYLVEKETLAERMSTILNTLPANIALLDEHGIIVDVNDAWRNFAGSNGFVSKDYGIGDNYIKITAAAKGSEKDDGKNVSSGIKSVLNKLADSFEYEYPFQTPDGETWFKVIVTPLLEKEKGGVVVMHLNITEQKKNEVALDATLKELSDYKIALDESSIVSITNPEGIITYVNNNFCEISKYTASELFGKNHSIVDSSFHEKAFFKNLWTTILGGQIWRNEIRNKAKDGEIYWLDATIVPFLDGKKRPVQFVAINKDITEKKLIEQKLLSQRIQEQKKVTRAMIIAQEKERNHLGEELHDNVNQILAGTKLYLGMIGQGKPEIKEMIKYPIELIDSSIEEIRMLCHRLATPLKNIDLNQMIKELLDTLSSNTPIKTGFIYSLSSEILNDDLKLNIYRIIQEQVNNIVKYAKAKNVQVSITEKDGILDIKTKDDGIGFDIRNKRKGIGISNMMHRIELYNGAMEIISTPGNGCIIDIKIPC